MFLPLLKCENTFREYPRVNTLQSYIPIHTLNYDTIDSTSGPSCLRLLFGKRTKRDFFVSTLYEKAAFDPLQREEMN